MATYATGPLGVDARIIPTVQLNMPTAPNRGAIGMNATSNLSGLIKAELAPTQANPKMHLGVQVPGATGRNLGVKINGVLAAMPWTASAAPITQGQLWPRGDVTRAT